MNPEERARRQRRLGALRERVEKDYEGLRSSIREESAHPSELGHVRTHVADADLEGLDVNIIAGQTETSILQSIEDALGRIQEGTYGICTDCGQTIPERRLCAVPYATRCVACERAVEAGR